VREEGSYEIFSVLYKHNTVAKVIEVLNKIKDNNNGKRNYVFGTEPERVLITQLYNKLGINCHVPLGERLQGELSLLTQTNQRKWKLFNTTLGLELHINEGFYRGDCLHFHIYFGIDYPHVPPVVSSLSRNIYHPFISENGTVQLEILQRGNWKPSNDLGNIIDDLELIFNDGHFLTSYFTL